jgi:hypothetical protein
MKDPNDGVTVTVLAGRSTNALPLMSMVVEAPCETVMVT